MEDSIRKSSWKGLFRISHEDWLPTFLAAAGVPDIVEKLRNGYKANGKEWKLHLDGFNFIPYFQGKVKKDRVNKLSILGK